jgi:hypothetical protein
MKVDYLLLFVMITLLVSGFESGTEPGDRLNSLATA